MGGMLFPSTTMGKKGPGLGCQEGLVVNRDFEALEGIRAFPRPLRLRTTTQAELGLSVLPTRLLKLVGGLGGCGHAHWLAGGDQRFRLTLG